LRPRARRPQLKRVSLGRNASNVPMYAARVRTISLLAIVAVSGTSAVRAQADREHQTPAAVLDSFFQALADERWTDAAGLLDPAELDAYRFQAAAGMRRRPRDLTVDDLLRTDSQMPRAVAEYEVERTKARRATYGDYLGREFAGVHDAAQLESLPVRDLVIRWLQAQHPALRLREQLRLMGCPPPPGLDSAFRLGALNVVGTILRSDTALVLFRSPWRPFPDSGFFGSGPQVAHLKREGSQWRILPRHDLVQPYPASIRVERCSDTNPAPGKPPR
jgi:hypothetical protein